MNSELRKKLLAELQKSGIPVEIRAVRDLRRARWLAIPSVHYQDVSGNLHEIDIYASTILAEHDEWPHFPPSVQLIIECKRSREKPWVFFEDNTDVVFFKEVFQRLRILADNAEMKWWPPACRHTIWLSTIIIRTTIFRWRVRTWKHSGPNKTRSSVRLEVSGMVRIVRSAGSTRARRAAIREAGQRYCTASSFSTVSWLSQSQREAINGRCGQSIT